MGVTKRQPFVEISVLAISRKITSLEAAIVSSAEAGGKVLRLFPHELDLSLRSHILRPDLNEAQSSHISSIQRAEPSVGVVNPRRGKVLMSIVRVRVPPILISRLISDTDRARARWLKGIVRFLGLNSSMHPRKC